MSAKEHKGTVHPKTHCHVVPNPYYFKEDNMKNAEIQTTLDPNDFNCMVVKKKKKNAETFSKCFTEESHRSLEQHESFVGELFL